jgi:hypothetical protein
MFKDQNSFLIICVCVKYLVLGNNKVSNLNVELGQLLIVWIKEVSNINLEIWFQHVKKIFNEKKSKFSQFQKKIISKYVRIFERTRS